MSPNMTLTSHFLIAMPSVDDPNLHKSVIYICEHHVKGTVGLIINQPMNLPVSFIFEQLHIDSINTYQKNDPILFGGPLQPERGFVIHRPFGRWKSSLSIQDGVTITTSNDIIRAIAKEKGPKDVLVTLGYVGWDEEQLEKEILDNKWLVSPYFPELLYDIPFDERWRQAGLNIGVDMSRLINVIGHG